jgi:hypothetical protein
MAKLKRCGTKILEKPNIEGKIHGNENSASLLGNWAFKIL